jgi:flavodoxin
MKTAVVYYSFEGNTAFVAEEIAKVLGADKFIIAPTKEIPRNFTKYILGGKQTVLKQLPEIEDLAFVADDYERIVLAAPVWAFAAAPAMKSFLNKYHITNKEIAVLLCSAGGPVKAMDNFCAELEKSGNKIVGKKHLIDPLKLFPDRSLSVARNWAEEIWAE